MTAQPAHSLVAVERRKGGRRSSDLHLVTSGYPVGEFSNPNPGTVFGTTHLRAKCELQLVEAQAAAEHAHQQVDQAMLEAEAMVDRLVIALRAAKAARAAAFRAAGTITNEVDR